jgi:hypothetical protein
MVPKIPASVGHPGGTVLTRGFSGWLILPQPSRIRNRGSTRFLALTVHPSIVEIRRMRPREGKGLPRCYRSQGEVLD